LAALTGAATVQIHAGIFDFLFGGSPDSIAAGHAKQFVADFLSKPNEAVFEKVDIVEKDGPLYLFHVVVTAPSAGAERARLSYLVCFKLDGGDAKFNKGIAVQDASDPPTKEEVILMKAVNGWPLNSSSQNSQNDAVSQNQSNSQRENAAQASPAEQQVPHFSLSKIVGEVSPPRFVTITQSVSIGAVVLPVGTRLEFVSKEGSDVRIRYEGVEYAIPVSATDLIDR
jgi:hypothetical protein